MADPATYRPPAGTIPTEPGVYRFRDDNRRVIYVGKAKSLRARLSNYFQDVTGLHPRTRQMVFTAASVEWTVVSSEVEALQLEYTWIKKYDPRFNVKYKDDKSYPMLAVSLNEQFPRAFVYRGPMRRGVRYFGPYSHAWAIRETLDLLIRVFPMRTCTKGVFNRHHQLGRPCLLGYIDKCAAPCVGKVSRDEHLEIVRGFVSFMNGHTDPVTKMLQAAMNEAAEELDFEKAARLRDDLEAINKVMEKQTVVLGDGTDADFISFHLDELEAAVQIFNIRAGRVKGQRGWVVERPPAVDDLEANDALAVMLGEFLLQFYSDMAERWAEDRKNSAAVAVETPGRLAAIPRDIFVQALPIDHVELESVLASLRGGPVRLHVPQRGDKKALLDTVEKNANEALRQHKLKRHGDLTARSAALQELQSALDMDQAPLRIECTDISHIQGTDVVASLVVFEDGLPKKSDYRRYKIKEAAGDGHSNDVASIAEVTRRRFLRHNSDKSAVPTEDEFDGTRFVDEDVEEFSVDPKRFAYPPQLFIVDGGLPQVNAAQEMFDELGVHDVMLIGLAKRLEEVWLPGEEDPLILSRNSPALFLLQQIRDEAHRFAITFHRQQRSKRLRYSELDQIKGLGQQRKADLVKHFGSVKRLKSATIDEIQEVPGIGPKLAETIFASLRSRGEA
ncbi:excinuclease ABC subunit UvrC [Corynebacterium epidermidicanis]|uniref:UvrABC system protein C n=1 Tax=Corynebacterium epidermidicanis TaxID=1050174 RepID=A0A0G3GPU6_9CORY|nr:excinuclease ABC subunit UvrC [Corynebacterium epidermidicanis]AKK03216.1 Excinuclease ABC subunit C [Corynebacterium epidermidicanis]